MFGSPMITVSASVALLVGHKHCVSALSAPPHLRRAAAASSSSSSWPADGSMPAHTQSFHVVDEQSPQTSEGQPPRDAYTAVAEAAASSYYMENGNIVAADGAAAAAAPSGQPDSSSPGSSSSEGTTARSSKSQELVRQMEELKAQFDAVMATPTPTPLSARPMLYSPPQSPPSFSEETPPTEPPFTFKGSAIPATSAAGVATRSSGVSYTPWGSSPAPPAPSSLTSEPPNPSTGDARYPTEPPLPSPQEQPNLQSPPAYTPWGAASLPSTQAVQPPPPRAQVPLYAPPSTSSSRDGPPVETPPVIQEGSNEAHAWAADERSATAAAPVYEPWGGRAQPGAATAPVESIGATAAAAPPPQYSYAPWAGGKRFAAANQFSSRTEERTATGDDNEGASRTATSAAAAYVQPQQELSPPAPAAAPSPSAYWSPSTSTQSLYAPPPAAGAAAVPSPPPPAPPPPPAAPLAAAVSPLYPPPSNPLPAPPAPAAPAPVPPPSAGAAAGTTFVQPPTPPPLPPPSVVATSTPRAPPNSSATDDKLTTQGEKQEVKKEEMQVPNKAPAVHEDEPHQFSSLKGAPAPPSSLNGLDEPTKPPLSEAPSFRSLGASTPRTVGAASTAAAAAAGGSSPLSTPPGPVSEPQPQSQQPPQPRRPNSLNPPYSTPRPAAPAPAAPAAPAASPGSGPTRGLHRDNLWGMKEVTKPTRPPLHAHVGGRGSLGGPGGSGDGLWRVKDVTRRPGPWVTPHAAANTKMGGADAGGSSSSAAAKGQIPAPRAPRGLESRTSAAEGQGAASNDMVHPDVNTEVKVCRTPVKHSQARYHSFRCTPSFPT